jgi:aldose 1-epimerase
MITLSSSTGSEVLVEPKCGGGIGAWRRHGRHVLRPAPVAVTDPLQLASFPLVPFSNRIAYGRFQHAGRPVQLARNWARDPHTIHGFGWTSPWRILGCTDCTASLELEYGAGDWPWNFRANQRISLESDVLDVSIALTNLSPDPMPAGLGHHPCFPRPPGTVLETVTRSVWMTDATGLPEHCVPVPMAWRFQGDLPLDGQALDYVFTGWNRLAMLRWPDGASVRMTASAPADFLVVYSPLEQELVCLEPVTHMTDAVNRPESPGVTGLRLLAPGETLRLTMRLEFHDS